MSLEKKRFKTDFISSSIELIKRTWLKMVVVEFIFTIVTKLFFTGLIMVVLSLLSVPEVSAEQDFSAYLFMSYATFLDWITIDNFIRFIQVLILVFIVSLLILIPIILWINTLLFSIIKNETEEQGLSIVQLLLNSFKRRKVPRTGCFFLVIIAVLAYFVSELPLIIKIPLLVIVALKSILAFPAYFFEEMSYAESFKFSFHKMTIKRCIKLCLYCVPIIASFFLLDYVFGDIFYELPDLLSFGLEILLTGFLMSIGYSLLTGLYCRYKDNVN